MPARETMDVIDLNCNSKVANKKEIDGNIQPDGNQPWEAEWKHELKEKMSMEESITMIEHLMKIFFQNRFEEAEDIARAQPDYNDNLYLKTAVAYKSFMYALFTLERPMVDQSWVQVKELYDQLSKDRKASKLSAWFFKQDLNEYTDEEAHAEVVYAEANLMSCVLTFASDPNIITLIRAAFKIRSAHSAYKLVGEILKEKTSWKSQKLRIACDDAYQVGWGFYNILISHLPDRVLKLLAFVGFDSDRDLGIQMCRFVTEQKRTFRHKVLAFLICFYSFYIEQFFGCGTADKEWVRLLTREGLKEYPNGVFDLFFGARMEQLEGNAVKSIEMFQTCIRAQDELPAIHSVCNWDMLWSYAIMCDWHKASQCALYLHEVCAWSKATNLYQYACFQYMIMEEENRPDMLPKIVETMKRVPEYKRRYAGKSIPPEKFAITKATAFLKEGSSTFQKMTLPAFELFYVWNIFGNTGENTQLLNPLVERIDKKMKQLREEGSEEYFVLVLLKGVCLRNLGRLQESIDGFREILNQEKDIKTVTYIPPHAAFELGISYLAIGEYVDAKDWLERARDHYTGFLIESLVHLRIHGAMTKLKELTKDSKTKNK